MASYDQLPAQQRAIVDLILKRGQSYDQLAETLEMPVERVRELARASLTSLAPVSAAAVEDGWRPQVADYLLGQQPAPEAVSTRGHLRRSEAARAWSRSVLDSLDHLYSNGSMPTIPTGETDAKPDAPPAAPETRDAPREPLSPEARAIVRRRRLIGGGAVAVVLLLALLVWPIGLLTGGDDGGGDRGASEQSAEQQAEIVGQFLLRPTGNADRETDAGIAVVTDGPDGLELNVQALVEPTKRNEAYEVWLTAPGRDPVSLGAQVTDQQGTFAGRAPLPRDYRDYRAVELTREPVDQDAAQSGTVVLRGRIASMTAGGQQGSGGGPSGQ